jgi:hypothetical protein
MWYYWVSTATASFTSGVTGMALMMETEEHHDEIACIIYDEYLYFAEAVAMLPMLWLTPQFLNS